MVKPILKKLASSSPKNSLDLDRGWEEQPVDFGYGNGAYESGRPSMSRSVRDVNFQYSSWEPSIYSNGGGSVSGAASGTATPVGAGVSVGMSMGVSESTSSVGGGGGGVGGGVGGVAGGGVTGARSIPSRTRFHQHTRSTSGTSHVSITTNGSSHRPGGSFVHPFQQQPRTTTPPLTYANSFTSFERENNPARDYSPTIITENDDDELDHSAGSTSLSQSLTSHLHKPPPSNSHSTASLRRPSLASQRTSSLSDIKNYNSSSANPNSSNPPALRVNTNPFPRSVPSASSRLAHGALNTSYSNSDLALNVSPTDSPRPSIHLASSSTNSATAMSPLRTSLEGAFRLRSRSEVDTGVNRVDIREARRKFEENERIKQEKYESEQRRKQERRQEKERAAARKNTGGSEMSSIGRPSFSRKRSPPFERMNSAGSAGQAQGAATAAAALNEKYPQPAAAAFLSSNYESTEGGATPSFGPEVNDVRFDSPKRAQTAKRKTQSYWTSFVLWFRTRLLKLGRR